MLRLTSTCTNTPSVVSVDYVLNGFQTIYHAVKNPTFSGIYNSGFQLDGPATIRVIAKDAFGSTLATSPDVAFTISNFGATFVWTSPACAAANTCVSSPLSGTINIAFTGNHSGSALAGGHCSLDGQPLEPPVTPTGIGSFYPGNPSFPLSVDTTMVKNGIHVIACYMQFNDVPGNGGTISAPRIQGQFLADIENGHAVMAVQPNINDIVMLVGDTFQLAPLLAYTDNTTASFSPTYSILHACVPTDPLIPTLPFPCTSGGLWPNVPTSNIQSAAHASVSGTGLITALALGQSVITITDPTSGKVAYVQVLVKNYKTVAHFGSDGTIKHTVDSKSIFRTSLFNLPTITSEPTLPAHIVRSKYTSVETQYWRSPFGYPTFAAWKTDWEANEHTDLVNALSSLPGLCVTLRSDGLMGPASTLQDAAHGLWQSWPDVSDPIAYALNTIKASGLLCGNEAIDEADNKGYNAATPIFSDKMADGSIVKIVSDGAGTATVTLGAAAGGYPANTALTNVVSVQGATTGGLNGLQTITQALCISIYGAGQCTPSGAASSTFKMTTSAPAGTYTSSTDAGLQILNWGNPALYTPLAGEAPLANDAFLNVVNRIKATGTPIAWPTIAMGGFVDQLQWQAPNMATYTSINSAADAQAFYFGNSFFQRGSQQYGNHFGLNQVHIASGDYVQYWQALFNQGYVLRTPDQPHIMTAGITGFDFETGGRPRQDQPALAITGMSGSIMTTSAPHGIGLPTNVVFPWVKVQITGNSDPAMNTNWYAAYPTSPTTVPLYSRTIGKPGCTPDQTTKGNVSIRGISHAVVISAYFNLLMVSPNAPSDLLPGEPIIWTGNGAACANDTYAFAGFNPSNPTTWLALSQYANSSGTGGTVRINDDYGFVNPLFDHAMFTGLPGTLQTDLALEAMWGDAGARVYTGASVAAAQAIFQATVPEDGAEQQTTASPYSTFPIDQQQRWWAGAQGLAFVKRLAPCYLGTLQPSPNFFAPWVRSGLTQCADGSKILTLINTSQISQVISVPLGTFQISINPISVYRIGYPYFTTDLITGAAGTISETIPPGAAAAFVAHSNTNSFVQLVPFSFTLPSGATKMALRFTYGYPGPLQEYEQSFLCPASPCLVPLDMSMARIYGQTMALDSNNVRLSTSDFVFLGGQ